jgi:hypothetical protein
VPIQTVEDFAVPAQSRVTRAPLVLLCYKRKTPQKGQRESCASSTRAIFIRRVVMEAGLCRSGRTRTARSEGRRDFGDW